LKSKIAFVGKAGSGKSTLARYLKVQYSFEIFSFASPVKEIAYKFFGMTTKDRTLLQGIGDGLREKANPLVWVNFMKKKIESTQFFRLIVDDCRYVNEAEMLRKEGFIIIKLEGRKWELTEEQENNSSEKQTEQVIPNFTLDTSKPLETTIQELEKIVFEEN